MFIDADTHVDECEDTWSYMPEHSRRFAPKTLEFPLEEAPEWLVPSTFLGSGSGYHRFWFINGQLFPRRIRSDERTGTTQKTRQLTDVAARLQDMDDLGVETQVLYPTVMLNEVTRRPEIQVALHQSYNRWLAERCGESGGRLRWVALIPYLSPEIALTEIAFAKEHGACGICKIGFECERPAGDPYFLPFYRRAAELDLAVCVHTGSGWSPVDRAVGVLPIGDASGGMQVIQAFSSLLSAKVHEKVPELRVGFIESGAAWLPYVLGQAGWNQNSGWTGKGPALEHLRFYVTCETYEDVPYLLTAAGASKNLVVGSDYSHGDRASVRDAHQQIIDRNDLDDVSKVNITEHNARALYSL